MSKKIKGTEEAWESGKLGQDEKFAKKSELSLQEMQALEKALLVSSSQNVLRRQNY